MAARPAGGAIRGMELAKKKNSGTDLLRTGSGVKNLDTPPSFTAFSARTDSAGPMRHPRFQMSRSSRDGADLSPDDLRYPGWNNGFFFSKPVRGKSVFYADKRKK